MLPTLLLSSQFLVVAAAFLVLLLQSSHAQRLPRIYILDIVNEYAPRLGLPTCSISHAAGMTIGEHGGELDGGEVQGMPAVHDLHSAQFSADWYVWASLFHSTYRTLDIDKADLVYVHWWCLMQDGVYGTPAMARLAPLWSQVVKSSRYRRTGGADYVVFKPFPLHKEHFCSGSHPIQIVCEAQATCDQSLDSFITAPYFSHARPKSSLQADENMQNSSRPMLLTFSGTCLNTVEGSNGGKRLRWSVIQALIAFSASSHLVPKTVLRCTTNGLARRSGDPESGIDNSNELTSLGELSHVTHSHMMNDLRRSTFCLVLAGDTVSSRRITESMLAGCLPVFVGPPFHDLPLSKYINYSSFALHFQFSSPPWVVPTDLFGYGAHPFHNGPCVNVTTVKDVMIHLMFLSDSAVKNMQKLMSNFQKLFVFELFHRNITHPMNANDILIHAAVDHLHKSV